MSPLLLALLLASPAPRELPEAIRLDEATVCERPGLPGRLELPPSVCYPAPAQEALDAHLKRQELELARLAAENASLRAQAGSYLPSLTAIGVAVGVGMLLGGGVALLAR